MTLVVAAMVSLPVSIVYMEWTLRSHSRLAEFGFAAVFTLMALRLVLRIREDGRVTEDLVRSEEDFRELVEASSDGVAIMDASFALLFASPAARDLLGIDADAGDDVCLLDLVVPEDREHVRALAEGEGTARHV